MERDKKEELEELQDKVNEIESRLLWVYISLIIIMLFLIIEFGLVKFLEAM